MMKPKTKLFIFVLQVAAAYLLGLAAPLRLMQGAERTFYLTAETILAAGTVLTVPWWGGVGAKTAPPTRAKMRGNLRLAMDMWSVGLPIGLVIMVIFTVCMTILTGIDTDVWPLLLLYAGAVLLGVSVYQVRRWANREEAFARFLAALYRPQK